MDKKYFSVDVSNDIHIVELHETLEQAKERCLECAKDAYHYAAEMDDFSNYTEYDLPYAVYGVVLGSAKSNIRPLTEEDDEYELAYYEEKDSIIEEPILVEANN
ncbi:hypothetical protein [Avibacterium paragallinarum]|uniref:Uncharacterized protein n=1 Tax=Avibacterium paragallinarum TaxID=728 RepID=A0AAE5WH75_AVIPA|nr:hypothetical protein [Avibacterium paragallinarum]MEE3609398.1 hypothetical protein [Avibacterium paragallinarum]MEE3622212.1 hypothetical protein [Avibacterium paragallinarum]MEE3669966.1 hypothetical protein [Avibacterium paragallinarum]MEE3682058.1 hypothetical protein [Avibacterium paragallinarum]MEE4386639.1 hypothetical protein [Avibacterium paragallinarum]